MKTIAIHQFGSAQELQETELTQLPLQKNEILITNHAFSINPMDIAGRLGMLDKPFNELWSFPIVLGWDFAGLVAQVGSDVTSYQVGDPVFGNAPTVRPGNNGTYSESIITTPELIAPIPAGLSFDKAAALPIAGLTAYCAIVKNLSLQENPKILIQGGAGGVGLIAVQIAKALGAYVAATASPSNHALLKEMGVDELIDYNQVSPGDVLQDYDAVFDTAGDIDSGLNVLKADGKLVTVAAQPTPEQQQDQQKQVSFQFTNGTSEDLTALANLTLEGKINLQLTIMPLSVENVQKAHEMIEGRHTRGKIVIHVKD